VSSGTLNLAQPTKHGAHDDNSTAFRA